MKNQDKPQQLGPMEVLYFHSKVYVWQEALLCFEKYTPEAESFLVPILSQMDPILPSYFFEIHFNIILPLA